MGRLSTSCVTLPREDPWKQVPFPQTSSHAPFPLSDLLCILGGNKSQLWVQLYAATCESSWWITEPRHGLRNPPYRNQPAVLCRLITLDLFHHGWGTEICSYWNRYRFWMWFDLCCPQSFWQQYHPWTCRMPYQGNAIIHNIVSDQGTHFVVKELQQWGHAYGIIWSYHISHRPEVADLIER